MEFLYQKKKKVKLQFIVTEKSQIKNFITRKSPDYPVTFPCETVDFITRRAPSGEVIETSGIVKFADGTAAAIRSSVSLSGYIEVRRITKGKAAAPVRLHCASQLATPREWRLNVYAVASGMPLQSVEPLYWHRYQQWAKTAYRAA